MTEHPYFDQDHTTRRAVVVVGLLAIVIIHIFDSWIEKFHQHKNIAWVYLVVIIACLVVAELLTRYDEWIFWLLAGLGSLAIIGGFVMSRTVGIPGDGGEDKGNWTEPLGMTSLLMEGVVVLMVAAHFVTMGTSRRRRARA